MKISIITATWNSSRTVADTIESILSQDYQDWEHIIVDGLSSDETLKIINSFSSRYRDRLHVVSEKDNGLYDAMNKGIQLATGDVIGILNSDDFFANCQVLSKIAENIEDVDAVYGNLIFVDSKDSNKVVRYWQGSQYSFGAFQKGWHPAHPTFYARKHLFEAYGGFDLSFAVSADFELMLRFLERKETSSKYIDYVIVKMRMGGESTGSIRRIIQGNKNILRAFRKNGFTPPRFYTIKRIYPKFINLIKTKFGL